MLFVLALSFASVNGWWYVSNFGVPWSNQFPEWHFGFTTMLLGLSVLALLLAAYFHFSALGRPADAGAPVGPVAALAAGDRGLAGGVLRGAFADPRRDGAVPGLVGGPLQPAGTDGQTCGLANDVLVETDPNAAMLSPVGGPVGQALGAVTSTGFPPTEFPPTSRPTR